MTTRPTRTMFITSPCALALAATAVALTACSSSGSGATSAAQAQLSRISAATVQSTAPPAPAGPTIDLAALDPCALLSPADANSVAHAEMLDEFQDPTTVYEFTSAKQPSADPSCKFSISDEDDQGTVTFVFQSATSFQVTPSDMRVSGLGDEAYDDGDDPVVRVGNVKISAVEDSFSDSVTVALLRKIIPKLK